MTWWKDRQLRYISMEPKVAVSPVRSGFSNNNLPELSFSGNKDQCENFGSSKEPRSILNWS